MIKPTAKLSIACIPLDKIQVKEFQKRFPEKLNLYIQLMTEYPDDYAGLLSVAPSDTHEGMYTLQDGHHRMAASIICGKRDALCVVIEEGEHEYRTRYPFQSIC